MEILFLLYSGNLYKTCQKRRVDIKSFILKFRELHFYYKYFADTILVALLWLADDSGILIDSSLRETHSSMKIFLWETDLSILAAVLLGLYQ